MEKPPIHRSVAEHCCRTGVRIRQNRLGSKLGNYLAEPSGNLAIGFIPRDSLEDLRHILWVAYAAPFWRNPAHGIEHAIGRIDTIQILRNFRTQKSTRDRVRRIAPQARRAP